MQQPDVFLPQKLVIELSEWHENQTESKLTRSGLGESLATGEGLGGVLMLNVLQNDC
jgi:hypothetical protein